MSSETGQRKGVAVESLGYFLLPMTWVMETEVSLKVYDYLCL